MLYSFYVLHPSMVDNNMRKIKLTRQLDQHGCTIACLSMITKIPYFQVRTILHNKIDRLKNYVYPTHIGLSCVDLQEALEKIFNIPCRFVKFLSLGKLKNHCILYICPITGCYNNGGSVHAIIFDAKRRRLIDPAGELLNLKNHNIICCIMIQK